MRYYRERAGGVVPIMGWVEGALAEAADLRGLSSLLVDLCDEPEALEEVLEQCTETAIAFARAQYRGGRRHHRAGRFCGFADLAQDVQAVCAALRAAHLSRQCIRWEALTRLHICGNISKLLPFVAQSGADIVDIDWMVDIGAASQICATSAVCGNFDPVAVMLQGSPETVRQAVNLALDLGGSRCFSMAGCEIPEETPRANLEAHFHASAGLRQPTSVTKPRETALSVALWILPPVTWVRDP